jgi:outer membrane protein TolC
MERSGKLILVIAIFFMGNVFAQEEEEVITKEEAIALALERNYGIEIAENEVEIAENNQGILNSGYLPSVTGRAGANYDLNDRLTEPENGRLWINKA